MQNLVFQPTRAQAQYGVCSKNGLHEVYLKIVQTKKKASPGMNYFEEMVLNGVLEILHSEFMIQHVCDGKALRNKLGDSDEKHPDQI